jgi:hypothetical protein
MMEKHKRGNDIRLIELVIGTIVICGVGILLLVIMIGIEDRDLSSMHTSQELFADLYEYCEFHKLAETQEGCEELALGQSNYIMRE